MSFSFGFSGSDYNDEIEYDANVENISSLNKYTDNGTNNIQSNFINPLDSDHLLKDPVVQAQIENYQQFLESLKDVRLTFEKIYTPETKTELFRRELFDIKHQLMTEYDTNSGENDANNLKLDILINEDLKKNVYEGGLKSWECSIDVVDSFAKKNHDQTLLPNLNFNKIKYIVELGCGTSLPTEYIFMQYLLQTNDSFATPSNHGIHFILADYNSSVLRLASLPNLIITWAMLTLSKDQWTDLQRCNDPNIPILDDELLLTNKLLDTFYNDMERRNVKISLISGSWGRKFNQLLYTLIDVNSNEEILLITSETIYQPENLPLISETLIDVHEKFLNQNHILVAAKDIYFGVGGSILDFQKYLIDRNINFVTFKINAGLKRSIVYI
ncbi:hypothetical protein RI543_003128 [Arxiozyma heterogenica]|uniref:Histidine protein methyltransferase 1 n=1 Tax=Arxiozyma heterogenica TaxID=278026 RepID=A0AAN7WGK2_9SACH|nr:hypothetical protein RI543_003128 [Kazachstania heterogenica]